MKKILIVSLIATLMINGASEVVFSQVNDNGNTIYNEEFISLMEQNSLELINEHEKILNEVQKEFEQARVEQEKIKQEFLRKEEEKRRLEEERKRFERENLNFNPYNVLQVSNSSVERIRYALPEDMKHLAQAYYDVEQEYGVNAFFLIAVTREESGNGTSYYFNYLNNIGGIRNADGSFRWFDSQYQCINYMGELLRNQYLTPYQIINGEEIGLYYNGESVWNINIKYCETLDWADKISNLAYEVLELAKEYEY